MESEELFCKLVPVRGDVEPLVWDMFTREERDEWIAKELEAEPCKCCDGWCDWDRAELLCEFLTLQEMLESPMWSGEC